MYTDVPFTGKKYIKMFRLVVRIRKNGLLGCEHVGLKICKRPPSNDAQEEVGSITLNLRKEAWIKNKCQYISDS